MPLLYAAISWYAIFCPPSRSRINTLLDSTNHTVFEPKRRHQRVLENLTELSSSSSRHGVPLVDRSVQVGTFKRFVENFHQVYDPDLPRASYKYASKCPRFEFRSVLPSLIE